MPEVISLRRQPQNRKDQMLAKTTMKGMQHYLKTHVE